LGLLGWGFVGFWVYIGIASVSFFFHALVRRSGRLICLPFQIPKSFRTNA